MEHLKHTTELIGMKDPNIIIESAGKDDRHIVIKAKLDYPPKPCPLCNEAMIKYDFQKPSTIPLLDIQEIQGMPSLLFQERRVNAFFGLIEEHIKRVTPAFRSVFKTFLKYKPYIINALELPYSNAKLEASNKLIKDIKRNAFGFRNFKNFKNKILIALNIQKERTNLILSRA
ncbi:hypothetical protein A0O21_05230 [Streptococcus pantholopis]|uniref:Transposase IS204/IS1001/IS1096/IS1165 DDE domain-containing protein n=1 Tax=Streptococcus pantholopis TaxID=1811193 RepID=A0A172Q7Q5_9STRE|nr:hypothetical protein A0O21_05230 [Streptococcus pantholopis]